MDENNINPMPVNEPENQPENEPVEDIQVEEETCETDVAAEDVVVADELVEDDSEMIQDEEASAEDDECVQETEYDEESEGAEESEIAEEVVQPKKKKSKGAVAALVILVALLIAATAFFVSVIMGSSVSTKIDHDEIAVTVGADEITVGEYLYWFAYVDAYYYNYYSYYYSQIPEDQIKSDTINQLAHTSALYNKAVEAGYELSEDDIAQIEDSLQGYKQAAEAESVEVDDYVAKNFGKGYTMEMLRTYLEKQAVAYKYYENVMKEIDDKFVGDDINEKVENAYKANKSTYDLSDVLYCYLDATDETAQSKADDIVAKVKDGMAFKDAVVAVAGDSAKISDSLVGFDSETVSANFNEDAAKWIFEVNADGEYVNKTGSATTVETEGVIYVLYVNNAPGRNESVPVTVDYVKVDVSTEDSIKSADELDLQAKSKASAILAEFEDSDKTAEAFAHVLLSASEDESGLVAGDSYEDMIADKSHDAAVEDWACAQDRKVGDYALVKGEDGYYVLYMREISENPVWYQSVYNSLVNAEKTAWEEDFIAGYEESIVSNDAVIDDAVAAFKKIASQNAE